MKKSSIYTPALAKTVSFSRPHLLQLPKFKNGKNIAFTLAEVLITLTIIGVIAAMTIPTLLFKYQKHTYAVALKKAYSQLQNAVKMIPLSENCPAGDLECAGWFNNDPVDNKTFENISKKQMYLLSKQFKTNKFCEDTDPAVCIPQHNKYNDVGTINGSFKTDDGMDYFLASSTGIFGAEHPLNALRIDVNGSKGPNKAGIDEFFIIIAPENKNNIAAGTVFPIGSKLHAQYTGNTGDYWNYTYNIATSACRNGGSGEACTGRLLEEGTMNY